jgi:hypothetical protein
MVVLEINKAATESSIRKDRCFMTYYLGLLKTHEYRNAFM